MDGFDELVTARRCTRPSPAGGLVLAGPPRWASVAAVGLQRPGSRPWPAGPRRCWDMGTGGGEVLSRLPARANRTVADRGMEPPNVPVAGRAAAAARHPRKSRSREPATTWTRTGLTTARLPFRDGSLDLDMQPARVLPRCRAKPRARAGRHLRVTQQVDYHDHDDLGPDAWHRDAGGAGQLEVGLAERQVNRNRGSVIEEAIQGR